MTTIELLKQNFLGKNVKIVHEYYNNYTKKVQFSEKIGLVEDIYSEGDEYHADPVLFILNSAEVSVEPDDEILIL